MDNSAITPFSGSSQSAPEAHSAALLAGVAEAAQQLLVITDFDVAINGALAAIATAAGIDRIFIYQNHIERGTQREFATCPYEWTVRDVVRSNTIPNHYPMFYDEIEGYLEWLSELKAGRPVQKLARDMSAVGQIKQRQEQTLSVLTVPIFIQGHYWGNFGFDDCTNERVWKDAEIAVLETAAAIFAGALQRQDNRTALEQRDALFNSVNTAAQCLVAAENLAQAIPEALKILGEGTQQDRVYVFKNLSAPETEDTLWDMAFEWTAPGIPSATQYGMHLPVPMETFPPQLTEPLRQGQAFRCLVSDMDGMALALNKDAQALSLVGVPIKVEDQWWGVLGFDDCKTERVWTDAEITVLETAATCIGNAISRDLNRQAQVAAAQVHAADLEVHNLELANRDRILEATAKAANVLLTDEDFEGAFQRALQIIGEAVGTDRVGIAQHLEDLTETNPGHWRVIYEWYIPEMTPVAQLSYPDPMQGTYAGAEQLYAIHQQGKGFSITTDQMSEPFRSSMAFMNVQTLHAVPVILRNNYWGTVVFGDCRQQRQRSFAELAALQTVADCIGNAIDRDRIRKEREATVQARAAAERTALIERERAARTDELEAANRILVTRERWLETTTLATNQLLSNDDIDISVNAALKIIGENLDCDRVWVLQSMTRPNASAGDQGFAQLIYEWYTEGQVAHLDKPEIAEIPSENFIAVVTQLLANQWVGGIVDELDEPLRSRQQSLGIQAFYCVPVFVDGEMWGVVGMDYCRQAKHLSAAEIAVFETAATCIGSAIYQAEVRRDRAAQERAAELEKVNTAIAQTLSTLVTKPQLSEFLGQLLLAIAQQIRASKLLLFLYDEATHTLNLHTNIEAGQVYAGASPNDIEFFHHPIPADITPKWKFINEAEGILMEEQFSDLSDEYWWPGNKEWHQSQGHVSTACIPMRAGTQTLGLIDFAFHERTLLTHEQLEFIQALTNQAIVAIQLTHLAKQARTNALTDERNRLAREIHDTLAQAFTGVSLQLEAAKGCLSPSSEDAQRFIDNAGQLARRGLSEARRSVHALRSQALEAGSLADALRMTLTEMTLGSPIQTKFQMEGIPFPLPEDIQINLLRIGQEAITNTLRHAQAQNLGLTLGFEPRQIHLTILDDGNGCQLDSLDLAGFGLLGMRERVLRFEGQFYFTSQPGQGTKIELTIPIERI